MSTVEISKESVKPFVNKWQKYPTNFVKIVNPPCWNSVSLENFTIFIASSLLFSACENGEENVLQSKLIKSPISRKLDKP